MLYLYFSPDCIGCKYFSSSCGRGQVKEGKQWGACLCSQTAISSTNHTFSKTIKHSKDLFGKLNPQSQPSTDYTIKAVLNNVHYRMHGPHPNKVSLYSADPNSKCSVHPALLLNGEIMSQLSTQDPFSSIQHYNPGCHVWSGYRSSLSCTMTKIFR